MTESVLRSHSSGFFFIIVFLLMSGVFTPLESMPVWAQKIDLVNPMAYIMRINRMIMLIIPVKQRHHSGANSATFRSGFIGQN